MSSNGYEVFDSLSNWSSRPLPSCWLLPDREKSWQWKTKRRRGRRNAQEAELSDFGIPLSLLLSIHTLITNTHPSFSCLLYCNVYTHTQVHTSLFFWHGNTSWPLLINKKKKRKLQPPLAHSYLAMHAHLHKNLMTGLIDCTIFLSGISACLHAWLLPCLSVSLQQPQYMCQYCLSVSLQYMRVCQPVCLSSSLSLCQPIFTSFPGCLSCFLPSCWRMISRGYFMRTWGGVSVTGYAHRGQHK